MFVPAHQSPLLAPQSARLKIEAAMDENDPAARMKSADALLATYPQDPFASYIKAGIQFDSDDKLASIPFAQSAVQKSNFEPKYVALLLRIYFEFRFFEQIDHVLSVVERFPHTSCDLELQKGSYYAEIGKLDTALNHLNSALTLTPTRSLKLDIQSAMVKVYRNAGKNEEALSVLQELVKIDETRASALFDLAELEAGLEHPNLENEILTELHIKHEELTAAEKTKLYLGLGRLQDRRKDYLAAFSSWQAARAALAETYSPGELERALKDSKSFYSPELYRRTREFANSSDAPLFVFGMPRSGTTLLAQILSAHPEIANAGEIGRLPRESANLVERYHVPGGLKRLLADSENGEIAERAHDFLRLCELMAGRKARYYVDKTPTQFLHAGYIHLCFPKVRLINVIRNPADIFTSTYQNDFAPNFTYAFRQESFAHYYLQRELFLAHWRKLFGSQILDVTYEELTADPEAQIRRILAFLDLEWDPACLKFFERPAMVNTFSRDQVRSSINTKSVGRWRNYEAHLGPLFDALKKGGVESLS